MPYIPRPKKPVYNNNGIVIGSLNFDHGTGWWVLTKHLKAHHKLQRPAGWAVDTSVLEELREYAEGNDRKAAIKLLLDNGGRNPQQLVSFLYEFDEHGIELDRRHGKQIVLVDKYWRGWVNSELNYGPDWKVAFKAQENDLPTTTPSPQLRLL